jgi:hypothetical protein
MAPASAADVAPGAPVVAPAEPSAQEPASQAIIDHDNQNNLNQAAPAPADSTTGAASGSGSALGAAAAAAAVAALPNVSQPGPQPGPAPYPTGPNPQADIAPDPRAAAAADLATTMAISHDDGTYGVGLCASNVTAALANSGINLNKDIGTYRSDGHGYAKNLGPVLTDANFQSVFSYNGSEDLDYGKFKPQKGDVAVIQPYAGATGPNVAGHVAIFNGKYWVSDFVQDDQKNNHPEDDSNGLYPGPGYRNDAPPFVIYRLPSSTGKK